MKSTFAEAKVRLQPFVGACYPDAGVAVNVAIQELSALRQWDGLKHLVRFSITKDYFSLPQACGRLLRCCVSGTPTSIRSRDFQFINSGLGEIADGTSFSTPSQVGVLSLGTHPIMCDPTPGKRLIAFATAESDPILVKTITNGAFSRVAVPINVVSDPSIFEPGDAPEYSSVISGDIASVVLPDLLKGYVYLFTEDGEFVSFMHPQIKVPEFVRYRLPGAALKSSSSGVPVSFLAETLVNPLPLVNDDDILPFDSLLPVQYMMQSLNAGTNNDLKGVTNFQALAEGTLVRHEEIADKAQRPLTLVNPVSSKVGGRNRSTYWGEYP